MRVALACAVLILVLVTAVTGSYVLGLHAIGQSQHKWCATLGLLTQKPVARPSDPAAHKSREDAYVFYLHLKDLERRFGC